jgi:hypothetical protein
MLLEQLEDDRLVVCATYLRGSIKVAAAGEQVAVRCSAIAAPDEDVQRSDIAENVYACIRALADGAAELGNAVEVACRIGDRSGSQAVVPGPTSYRGGDEVSAPYPTRKSTGTELLL